MDLVWANCRLYNAEGAPIDKACSKAQKLLLKLWRKAKLPGSAAIAQESKPDLALAAAAGQEDGGGTSRGQAKAPTQRLRREDSAAAHAGHAAQAEPEAVCNQLKVKLKGFRGTPSATPVAAEQDAPRLANGAAVAKPSGSKLGRHRQHTAVGETVAGPGNAASPRRRKAAVQPAPDPGPLEAQQPTASPSHTEAARQTHSKRQKRAAADAAAGEVQPEAEVQRSAPHTGRACKAGPPAADVPAAQPQHKAKRQRRDSAHSVRGSDSSGKPLGVAYPPGPPSEAAPQKKSRRHGDGAPSEAQAVQAAMPAGARPGKRKDKRGPSQAAEAALGQLLPDRWPSGAAGQGLNPAGDARSRGVRSGCGETGAPASAPTNAADATKAKRCACQMANLRLTACCILQGAAMLSTFPQHGEKASQLACYIVYQLGSCNGCSFASDLHVEGHCSTNHFAEPFNHFLPCLAVAGKGARAKPPSLLQTDRHCSCSQVRAYG